MQGKMFAEATAQAYASFASVRYVQLSLSIRLELPDPRRYIEPKKRIKK